MTQLPSQAQECGLNVDFVLLGGASQIGPGCYQITDTLSPNAKTAMWNRQPISLRNDFDFSFRTNQCGEADGFVFVLQQQGTGVNPNGFEGGTLNYFLTNALGNSLAVEVDIYNNLFSYNDPDDSHIAIVGNSESTPLAGPVSISPILGGCADHQLRLTWVAAAQRLSVYLDGRFLTSYSEDVINTRFGGRPDVTFGFVASTGARTATQTICAETMIYNGAAGVDIVADGPTHFCLPDSVGLRVAASPSGAASYTWRPAEGLNTDTGRVVVATPDHPTVYTLEARFANGCITRDSILVSAHRAPDVDLFDSLAICRGQSVRLSVGNPEPEVVYQWSPANSLDRDTGPTVLASPRSSTVYILTAADTAGCTSTDSVLVRVQAQLAFTLMPDRILCPGDSAVLAGPDLGPGAFYVWSPSTGLNAADTPNVKASPATATRYTLIATDSGGCSGRASVTVAPADSLAATAVAEAKDFERTVQFQVLVSQGAATGLAWDFGDGSPHDSTPNPIHAYARPGVYPASVTLHFALGCIKNVPVLALARFLPNVITPNGDGLNDTFAPVISLDPLEVEIYNRWGKRLLHDAEYKGTWGSRETVSPGTYFFRLATASGESWRGWLEVVR